MSKSAVLAPFAAQGTDIPVDAVSGVGGPGAGLVTQNSDDAVDADRSAGPGGQAKPACPQ